jgi:hypothetical protein
MLWLSAVGWWGIGVAFAQSPPERQHPVGADAYAPTPTQIAASDVPGSRNGLFDDGDHRREHPAGEQESRESLFGDSVRPPSGRRSPWRGYVRGELAHTYAEPAHWSKMLVRGELAAQSALTDSVQYKVGARLDYDFVYDATDF